MFLFPWMMLPTNYDIPPTLYSIMNSMANFDEEEKTKIKDLASATRSKIFDFSYPLTDKIDKEEFEVLILNKFLMRRIGFDTMTAFKIALNVKLNEIMPNYNKLFDMLDGWDMFNDGEITNLTSGITRQDLSNSTNTTTNTTTNNSINNSSNISDRRYSDTPQNELQNIKDGKYITDYNYDTDTAQVIIEDNIQNNTLSQIYNSGNGNESKTEVISRTPADKIKIYKEFLENKQSIYTLIFKDLECLFYGLV